MLRAYFNSIKVPELRKRILFTFGILAVCRLAANIPVPGINPDGLKHLFAELAKTQAGSGVMGMVNIFSGGALQKFAVAALGIMPYISASIIIQLMTPVFPALEKLQREGDSGRQKISQWTRYLTLVICVVQGWMLAAGMENAGQLFGLSGSVNVVDNPGFMFRLTTVIIMMAGTMALMWLGEQITERGIGNGISIIITVNIISRLPEALVGMFNLLTAEVAPGESEFTMIHLVLMILFFLVVTAGAVALSQGVRQIPIRYAARRAGASSPVGQTTYMPLKVNFSGVMPLIFAGAVFMFVNLFLNYLAGLGAAADAGWFATTVSDISRSVVSFLTYGSNGYMVFLAVCIIVFSFFWVANQFNPVRIADDLKRGGAYVPGVRPGQPTAEYIDHTMTYITVVGTLGLVILAIIPVALSTGFNIPGAAAQFFGGSSLLIMVGVVLDVLRQIEANLVARNYDGFLSKGRLKGRRNSN